MRGCCKGHLIAVVAAVVGVPRHGGPGPPPSPLLAAGGPGHGSAGLSSHGAAGNSDLGSTQTSDCADSPASARPEDAGAQ